VSDELDPIYEQISGGLGEMMDRADQWRIASSQVREDEVIYEAPENLTVHRSLAVCIGTYSTLHASAMNAAEQSMPTISFTSHNRSYV
jgi:hypothetical protein